MNYPDNIRQYDDNPNSPCYDDSAERALKARTDEIAGEMLSQDGYTRDNTVWRTRDVIDHIYNTDEQAEMFCNIVADVMDENSRAAGLISLGAILARHAGQLASDLAEQEAQEKAEYQDDEDYTNSRMRQMENQEWQS